VALASNLRVSFAVGGEGLYHTAEWLGVGLRSQLSLPFRPSTTDRRLLLAPELVLIPYEHRASLFHAIYFHYDLHLQAGPARVWSWGRPGSHSTWAALVGGGLTGFSASSFSMSLDYRAIIDASLEHVLALSFDFWPQTRKWDELMAPPNR